MGSGLLLAGALSNALSARRLFASSSPTDRSEGMKSALVAAIGLAGAGYLGYRAHQAKRDE
jgi:hypothetical protein